MKIGLVLSGGGARGVAHLGVLQALTEHGIRPDIMSCASAGAIAGALFAQGYEPKEILDIISQINLIGHVRPAFRGNGMLRLNRLEALLLKYIPHNSFEALKIPLVVNATDLEAGSMVCFRTGALAMPILGSCAIPGIFEPLQYQGKLLVDAGILNNMPVEVIESEVDFIIGSHCNPFSLTKPLKSTSEVIARSYLLALHSKNMERIQKCHLLFEAPNLRDFSIFDLSKAKKIFHVAYEHATGILATSARYVPKSN